MRAHMSWKSSDVHKSDILAVSHCSALGVAATASYDGDVVIWRLETQGPLLHLRRATQAEETIVYVVLLKCVLKKLHYHTSHSRS